MAQQEAKSKSEITHQAPNVLGLDLALSFKVT